MSCATCGKYLLALEWCLTCDGKPIRNADKLAAEIAALKAEVSCLKEGFLEDGSTAREHCCNLIKQDLIAKLERAEQFIRDKVSECAARGYFEERYKESQ